MKNGSRIIKLMAKKQRYTMKVVIEGLDNLTPENWDNFLIEIRQTIKETYDQAVADIHREVVAPQIKSEDLN